MNKLIIFDLDGTFLDTSDGIMYCYKTTGKLLGLEKKTVENEKFVIGGPLKDGFSRLYNIHSEKELENAVDTYRTTYSKEGLTKFTVYEGIEETLKTLKENGYLLAVATLKLEDYARQMLKQAGLADYFNLIHGWDGTDKCTKAFIITKILYTLNALPVSTVLVGDSDYDEKGAEASEVDFLGVSYGFGITKDDAKLKKYPVVNSTDEIADYIINEI